MTHFDIKKLCQQRPAEELRAEDLLTPFKCDADIVCNLIYNKDFFANIGKRLFMALAFLCLVFLSKWGVWPKVAATKMKTLVAKDQKSDALVIWRWLHTSFLFCSDLYIQKCSESQNDKRASCLQNCSLVTYNHSWSRHQNNSNAIKAF